MSSLKKAWSGAPRGLFHAAAVLAMGCSAGAGDSSPSADGPTAEATQELRLNAHPAPPKSPHHPVPPPHHPGHGRGIGGSCNPQTPGGGAAGTAGSASSTGGFNSGAGGSSAAGGPGSGDSGGGFTSSGGAPEGGFTSSGGAPEGGFTSSGGAGGSIDDPCGDGVQIFNACDDGNTVSGDGCSATCDIEPGYACTTPGAPCRQQRCGDGFQDTIFTPGDPTSSGGAGDGVFGTGGSAGVPGTYTVEGCDDGNTVSGDGCSATCDVEPGFICTAPGTLCHEPRCGDGIQDFIAAPGRGPSTGGTGGTSAGDTGGAAGAGGFGSFEACDDGNTVSGDGCSASCDIEDGYVCVQPNTPCRKPRCGDGFVDFSYPGTEPSAGGASAGGASFGGASAGGIGVGGASAGGAFGSGGAAGAGSVEQCDDGNTTSGDGCSATCQIE